jgi:capsule polysaccharide modification protein KpsS
MVCVCKDHSHWAYFLPFRALGYKLTPIFDDTPDALAVAASQLENCEFDALAVFNPYMKSHAKFYTAFLRAKELGREIFVVERGALPNTVYYSDDVSYNSHWFSEEAFAQENLSEFEISTAEKYITDLRSGNQLLESGDSRSTTDKKYEAFRSIKRTKIFIPLQLHDDMAVTKYVRAAQSYTDFVEAIIPTARANQEILFLIKPHPLSKYAFPAMPENVIMADREDNIHSLLDCCSSVICYNSGVGLLAACHGRRLITIGNAFYNHSGIGHFADNLKDAVAKCTQRVASPDVQIVTRLIGTFLFRRYSVFWATDVIQEFKDRKAHKYVNIKVLRFVTKAGILNLNWEAASNPFGDRSYAAGIANFGDLGISGKKAEAAPPAPRLSEEEIRTKALTAFSSRLFDVAEGHFIAAFDISRKPAYLRAAAEAALLRGQKATAIQHLQKAAGIAQKKGGVLKRLREMNRPAMLRLLPQHPYDVTSV